MIVKELLQGVKIKFLGLLRSFGQSNSERGEAELSMDRGQVEYGGRGADPFSQQVLQHWVAVKPFPIFKLADTAFL